MFGYRILRIDLAPGGHVRQQQRAEDVCDGADFKHRVSVGRGTSLVGQRPVASYEGPLGRLYAHDQPDGSGDMTDACIASGI